MLESGANVPYQQQEMVTPINRALEVPSGPDAGVVLHALIKQVGPIDPAQATRGSAAAALITGIDFAALPPERQEQAIAYVIRAAGTQPLAAAWLNPRLLGPANQATVGRTRALLADRKSLV